MTRGEYDFERMKFDPVEAREALLSRDVQLWLNRAFTWEHSPQRHEFWHAQFAAGKLSDKGRAAIEDMLRAYNTPRASTAHQAADPTSKLSNPKDALSIRKWRQFSCIPLSVISEIGVGMLEGARKYGPFNWRQGGARSSVYVDAALGHIMQWQEGEDIDADSGLSHITKAITSLVVLRDAMLQGVLVDDRPPAARLDELRAGLQTVVERIVPGAEKPKAGDTGLTVAPSAAASSHQTRFSDSSLYDEVCTLCGATDAPGDYRLSWCCPVLCEATFRHFARCA